MINYVHQFLRIFIYKIIKCKITNYAEKFKFILYNRFNRFESLNREYIGTNYSILNSMLQITMA